MVSVSDKGADQRTEGGYPFGDSIVLASSPEAGPRYDGVTCRSCGGGVDTPKFEILREFRPGKWTRDYICEKCKRALALGEVSQGGGK
jgi:hypothetical protein